MSAPRYSIITICKGRLHHLVRSLPALVRQPQSSVIVVDYNCPDGTGDYVAANFPGVTVVRERTDPGFNASRARNLGAAEARCEQLVFVDADVIVADNFVQSADQRLRPGTFAKFPDPQTVRENSLQGTCIVPRADFERCGRYDELIRDYGGEDLEFYARLIEAGLVPTFLDDNTVAELIEHTPAERERFMDKDATTGFLVGKIYRLAKISYIRMNRSLDVEPPLAKKIYDEVVRLVGNMAKSGKQEMTLRLHFPDDQTRGLHQHWSFKRSIVLKVERR